MREDAKSMVCANGSAARAILPNLSDNTGELTALLGYVWATPLVAEDTALQPKR